MHALRPTRSKVTLHVAVVASTAVCRVRGTNLGAEAVLIVPGKLQNRRAGCCEQVRECCLRLGHSEFAAAIFCALGGDFLPLGVVQPRQAAFGRSDRPGAAHSKWCDRGPSLVDWRRRLGAPSSI